MDWHQSRGIRDPLVILSSSARCYAKLYVLHYGNMCIALDKSFFFFNQNILIFRIFLHENIFCGYSLIAPCQCTSNEYSKRMFS